MVKALSAHDAAEAAWEGKGGKPKIQRGPSLQRHLRRMGISRSEDWCTKWCRARRVGGKGGKSGDVWVTPLQRWKPTTGDVAGRRGRHPPNMRKLSLIHI